MGKIKKLTIKDAKKLKEWKHAITFDVVKLGQAYDKKKLSKVLMKKLEPYIKKEEKIRMYTRDISKAKKFHQKKQN